MQLPYKYAVLRGWGALTAWLGEAVLPTVLRA
jgi:hypothetical protein